MDAHALQKNALSPARLMVIVWAICLLAYPISFGESPTFRVVAWVVAMVSIFSGSASIDPFGLKFRPYRGFSVRVIRNVCFLLLPIQIYYLSLCLTLVFSNGGLANYLVSVRLAALSGEPLVENYTFYLQINMTIALLSLFGLARILLIREEPHYKTNFYFCYISTILASLIDGSRSFFIVCLFSIVALNLSVGKLSIRRLVSIIIFMLVFFTVTFALFRQEARGSSTVELIRYTLLYLCGTIGSLDPVLRDEIPIFWTTLESLSNKLNAIGLPFPSYELSELKADYVDLPYGFSSNVFSAFGLYYHYMGILGSFVFVAVTGWISGIVYRNRFNSALLLTVFSLIWPAIVLSPFHDFFLQQGYAIIKVAIYIYLINRVGAMWFRAI